MHGHWLKGYLRDGKEIEGGGGGSSEGNLIVTLSGEMLTADKTFGEIEAALNAKRPVFAFAPRPGGFGFLGAILACGYSGVFGAYNATLFRFGVSDPIVSKNESAATSDYPVFGEQISS